MDNHLKRLRAEQGWSQADLAEKLDVTRQTVIALERGRYDPSLKLAFRLSRRCLACRSSSCLNRTRG